MTQLQRLKLRLPNETDNDLLADILESSKSIIQNRRYPFGDIPSELEGRYLDLQIRIAIELYNKQGAEGQIQHSENGVARIYESADVSPSLLREIVPKGAIL